MWRMETAAFRLDTGATWLNLLATRGSAFGRHPEERIPTPERFADWLAAVELDPETDVTAADLELARHLRETLRPLALSAATGEAPGPEAAAGLIAFLRAHDEPLSLVAAAGRPSQSSQPGQSSQTGQTSQTSQSGPPDQHELSRTGLSRPAPKTAAAALGRIARQAADQLTGPERHALKSCPESDCRGVFADPDGRRRWCPSPTCASRGRVRAYRARKAVAAAE
jgi:predicted RNA-binding Zn ribbon-like protein